MGTFMPMDWSKICCIVNNFVEKPIQPTSLNIDIHVLFAIKGNVECLRHY